MRARFDDVRGRTGFELTEPVDEVVVHRIDEVVPALRSVEEMAARGLWAAGVVSYEAAPAFDPALRTRPGAAPLLHFGLFRSRRPIEELSRGAYRVGPWEPSVDERIFGRAVDRIRRLIEDGDTYQVNFTFRLHAGFEGDAEAFYEDLSVAQAGAFSAYLDLGDRKILSASPELFFELAGSRLATRPMKGTRPRGRWTLEDLALADELTGSSKERAENVMIVDLMRNDLGRISEFGSVVVDRLFEAERYPAVWQLTSTVTSSVRPEVGVTGIFRALFPSGSVTGAPKPRAMEIIAELEDRPRGPYCGAIGFIAPPAEHSQARFSVGIRTVLLTGRHAEFGVGAGITHPSSGDAEYRECLTKAAMLGLRRPAVGLVESLRWEVGFLWEERHLDRLEGSAAYFGLPFNRPEAKAALRRAVRGRPAGPHKVRLVLDESGEMSVTCEPLLDSVEEEPLVAVDSEPVDSGDPLLFHKTTHREPFQRRLGRHAEADDVLLVNERGELTESTVANLVVRLDGRWWTPPLESGCLPGVYRAVLVEEGIVSERVLRPEDLERADGIGLVNSVRLWRPARLIRTPVRAGAR